jgi:hypothetical protein
MSGSGRILIGTAEGLFEFGGRDPSRLEPLAGVAITALAAGGEGDWALVEGRTLWRSSPGGPWRPVAAIDGPRGTCLARTPAGLLVGTAGAHLLRLEADRLVVVQAFEHVDGRRDWRTPWGDPPDTRSIAAAPDGALFVNVHVGGIARSTDGGRSWRPTVDPVRDVHQVVTHGGHVLAASAAGLGLSTDGGDTWRFETAGLHGAYLRAVAVAGDVALVTASTGHRSTRAAVYRRPLDAGARFERCQAGLPRWFGENIDTGCLAASADDAAFGTGDGEPYRSSDAGARWERVAKALPPVTAVVVD